MAVLKINIKRINSYQFSESEKRTIVEDYLQSGLTKQAIWKKYTDCDKEHGRILEWLRKFGYNSEHEEKKPIFVAKTLTMSTETEPQSSTHSDFELNQFHERIIQLESQLRSSELECLAWQTMVELSEKEFNISIKKKYNIKPSKS